MGLPRAFVWSKIGTEGGEDVSTILQRKDEARQLDGGMFLWGIGQPIWRSLRLLTDQDRRPEVLFTPMRAKPAKHDVAPLAVARWQRGAAPDGAPFAFPENSLVTSSARAYQAGRGHWALVCHSAVPILGDPPGLVVEWAEVENLLSGRPVGAQQVTAVVRSVPRRQGPSRSYAVSFSAVLVPPYVVTLKDPVIVRDPFSS